jgi:poly(3-hydroxyoctanoate) depolymerase
MTKITPIAEMSTDRTFFAHVGPTRVRVRTVGDGPALLLLMGIGGNLDMWDPLAQRLPGRRLIMFDFPGAGASSSSFLPPTMMHNALFTRLLMLRLGYGRADVLGYSWGGLLAQELAFQHPWAVRRLVLAATSLGLSGIPPAPQVIWRMLTTRRFYSPEYLAEIAASTYGGRFRREPGLVAGEVARRIGHPPSRTGYALQLTAVLSYSGFPLLPWITARTLVLAGDDDPIVPTLNQRILSKLLRRSELQLVPRAGHLLLIDTPDVAANTIERFLTRP